MEYLFIGGPLDGKRWILPKDTGDIYKTDHIEPVDPKAGGWISPIRVGVAKYKRDYANPGTFVYIDTYWSIKP